MKTVSSKITTQQIIKSLLVDFLALTKVRLSVSVVFSSIAGYLLAVQTVLLSDLLLLSFGGYFMVGASNTFNQIIETEQDRLMKRTANRPLPAGRVGKNQAFILAVVFTILGLVSLYILSPKAALFGAVSIFLYTSVYTPLKTITPLSVFAGAIPGAIPFMLGWVAATQTFGIEPGVLFMMQFFWQFPHFWAIGWLLDDDYTKAGFKMLPTGKKDKGTAVQIILYTIWTLLVSVIPYFGFTGSLKLSTMGLVALILIGLGFLLFSLKLFRKRDNTSAKQLILASVLYITLLQLVYVFDKWLVW